jgi:hypothetical protein
LINNKRYDAGYALMSARLRTVNSPADYASWFTNKVAINPVSVELISQSDSQAIVRSVVETTDRVAGAERTARVAEEFVMRYEDGAWRIDRVTRL